MRVVARRRRRRCDAGNGFVGEGLRRRERDNRVAEIRESVGIAGRPKGQRRAPAPVVVSAAPSVTALPLIDTQVMLLRERTIAAEGETAERAGIIVLKLAARSPRRPTAAASAHAEAADIRLPPLSKQPKVTGVPLCSEVTLNGPATVTWPPAPTENSLVVPALPLIRFMSMELVPAAVSTMLRLMAVGFPVVFHCPERLTIPCGLAPVME